MSSTRVTRNSSCGTLNLPPDIACDHCIPSIIKALLKGAIPKRIKKCNQPWATKWSNHRELGKVERYTKVRDHLGHIEIDGDVLIETRIYSKQLSTCNTTESEGDKSISLYDSIINGANYSRDNNSVEPNFCEDSNEMSTIGQDVSERNEEVDNEEIDNNENEVVTLNTRHCIIHRSKLGSLQNKASKYDRLMKQLRKSRYDGTPLGDAMIGYASSLVPQCGHSGVAATLPFMIGSLFANAGLKFDVNEIVNSQPSDKKIQKCVEQNAVNTMIRTRDSIRRNPNIYVSADKGNKKGNKNLAKFVCWYDTEDNEVKIFLLDVDCTDEHTDDIADALTHSLQRLLPINLQIKIRGQCTDSGGGGTKFALAKALEQRDIVHETYLVSTCSLHNLQTCLRNAVVNVLGEGGMNEKNEPLMNVMQMLHGAYNLQNWQEDGELKQLWTYLSVDEASQKFKKLEEPIMTRWWLVGACACSFKESMITWRKICKAIRNSVPSGSASSKIASCTLNLIDKPIIVNDLHLMCFFHEAFLFKHFKFLQLADKRASKTPSFQARLLLVRYFLMASDLKEINTKWRTHHKGVDYNITLQQLNETDKVIQKQKFTHFLRYVSDSLKIHFQQWTSNLLFLGLFSNQLTATTVAKFIIGRTDFSTVETNDKDQQQLINMREFASFLKEECNIQTIMQQRNLPVVRANIQAINLIAEGGDIWSDDACEVLSAFRTVYLKEYSALPTNTQFTERGVKESGTTSLGRRGETNRSIFAMSRGKLIPEALKKGRAEIQPEVPTENEKAKQVQAKYRTKLLLKEVLVEQTIVQSKRKRNDEVFEAEEKEMKIAITDKNSQFKTHRINSKVEKVVEKALTTPAPNQYERRTGQTLTPLMQGKIQYHKLKKAHNLEQVRNELKERELPFDQTTNWTALLKILKEDEQDKKYFKPRTNYDNFKWNSTHFDANGEVV